MDILFIYYLQLIDMRTKNKNYNREQEVSATSRLLKILAKELEIPVVVLSQLNRSARMNVATRNVRSFMIFVIRVPSSRMPTR